MTGTNGGPATGMRPAAPLDGRRSTLTNVADLAGVSISTVSKVINGRTGVGPQTRVLVEDAIRELGYVSFGERQSALQAAREMSVELLVDPLDTPNPYLSVFLAGAMAAATRLRLALVLRAIKSAGEQEPTQWAQGLARAGRAGVIEVTTSYSARRERALVKAGLPMVLVDPIDVPRTATPSIGATNWEGAYTATSHLLGLGHRRIRYIGGPPGARCDALRAHGWAAACSEAGIETSLADVPRHSYTFEHGLEAATALLSGPEPPTAIFAGSDTCASGVYEAARRLGIAIPGRLSVVGFDDTILAHAAAPPLTTVHQPIAEIGQAAVATVERLARGETLASPRVELATRLVIRESTAPPSGVQ